MPFYQHNSAIELTSHGAGHTRPVNSGKLLVCSSWDRASRQLPCNNTTLVNSGDFQFTMSVNESQTEMDNDKINLKQGYFFKISNSSISFLHCFIEKRALI